MAMASDRHRVSTFRVIIRILLVVIQWRDIARGPATNLVKRGSRHITISYICDTRQPKSATVATDRPGAAGFLAKLLISAIVFLPLPA